MNINQLVYYRETDTMVPSVKASLQTSPRMQRSWSDNNTGASKAVVESSQEVEGELGPSVEGSPQYNHIGGH
jgi:hypothetical protein